MRNMNIRHQQAIGTDARLIALARRSMNRRALSNDRSISYECITLLAFELQILRLLADGSKLENPATAADRSPTVDNGVRSDHRALSDLDVLTDHTIRTNLNAVGNAGARGNHGA